MSARIYSPAKTAMQSKKARSVWVLEFDQEKPLKIEPLMGYASSRDTRKQVRLNFESLAQAEAHARREGIAYRVFQPETARRQTVSYTDNFRFDRVQPWTH